MPPATEVITELIGRQYFVMAFLVVLGALQIAVSIPGIRGMMILPGRIPTRFLGAVLIVLGIVLFYLMPLWVDGPWAAGSVESDSTTREWGRAAWSDLGAARNVNDVDGGLSGTDHARWFPMAMALALVTSLAGGTVMLWLFPAAHPPAASEPVDGLAGLSTRPYLTALRTSLPDLRASIKDDAESELARHPRSIFGWIARRLRS